MKKLPDYLTGDLIAELKRRGISCTYDCPGSPRRPPCVVMTASASIEADCGALKKMCAAGYEVVIIKDDDFEESLRIIERVRKETAK